MLQGLVEKLTIPGLPAWVALVLLAAIAVSILAFLAMPFAVFGVKSRLEAIEAELADLRLELRSLVLQGKDSLARAPVEVDYVAPPMRSAPRAVDPEPRMAPPVPPPPAKPRAGRAEPRLDWPKADRGA